LTLGCGTWGGSITADNVTPLHLINIKRLAYEIKPLHPIEMTPELKEKSRWRYNEQYHYRPTEHETPAPETRADAPATAAPLPGAEIKYGSTGITEEQIEAIIKEFGKGNN
jgi:hypothetical protein